MNLDVTHKREVLLPADLGPIWSTNSRHRRAIAAGD